MVRQESPLQQLPADAPDIELSTFEAEDMALTAEIIAVFQDPAMRPLFEMEGANNPLAPLHSYGTMQMFAMKAASAVVCDQEVFTKAAFEKIADERWAITALEAALIFSAVASSMATSQDSLDSASYLRRFRHQDMDKAAGVLVAAYISCAREELVDAEGNCSNMLLMSQLLDAIAVCHLFTPGNRDKVNLRKFADLLDYIRDEIALEPGSDQERAATDRYVEEFRQPDLNGVKLAQIGRNLSPEQRLAAVNATLQSLVLGSRYTVLSQVDNPPEIRRQFMQAFRALASTDIPALQQRIQRVRAAATGEEISADDGAVIIAATELRWEVLPEEELQARAAAIVQRAQERYKTKVEIDVGRLAALGAIRHQWGHDKSFYAYGQLGGRTMVLDGEREAPDQYLLAVLQETDEQGVVTGHRVVAESPIAGPHAMYVFREDVSAGNGWEKVLALPKRLARGLGARALRHVAVEGESLHDTMTRKAMTLVTCSKDAFPHIKFVGSSYRIPRGMHP